MNLSDYALTAYSHGGGCGCKIAPSVLDTILHQARPAQPNANLLVGNQSRDDAAVYNLGNGQALISTTDFFMPIVDDAFDFGRIASANAISDVYTVNKVTYVLQTERLRSNGTNDSSIKGTPRSAAHAASASAAPSQPTCTARTTTAPAPSARCAGGRQPSGCSIQ